MFKESFPEIGSNTYIDKILYLALKNINVEKFHGIFRWDAPVVNSGASLPHHSLRSDEPER